MHRLQALGDAWRCGSAVPELRIRLEIGAVREEGDAGLEPEDHAHGDGVGPGQEVEREAVGLDLVTLRGCGIDRGIARVAVEQVTELVREDEGAV